MPQSDRSIGCETIALKNICHIFKKKLTYFKFNIVIAPC